jgi:Icc-related predicted phosphoesterase
MFRLRQVACFAVLLSGAASLLVCRSAGSKDQEGAIALEQKVSMPFRFAAFGDTRFHDPGDTQIANAAVRQAIVRAIAKERPGFISIGGDIVYNGDQVSDWGIWDSETRVWQNENIPVYPAIGNHDLHGNESVALKNYFARFPQLKQHRYYSVRIVNCLMLVLDSALDETSGSQGDWLRQQLNNLPGSVQFVLLVMHHPPITSSSDEEKHGGHSIRTSEQIFGAMLEKQQQQTRARFIVFAGHVHNYERFEHGGVTYFVTGGGGAHAYAVERKPQDLFQSTEINYHYLLAEVTQSSLKVTMHRLELKDGREVWTEPDSVTIQAASKYPLGSGSSRVAFPSPF